MRTFTRRAFLTSAIPAMAADPAPPNVVFLMSDEHSPHAAGWLGNRIVRTPALDSLAAGGVGFSAACCQNPICVPSRASFVTGRMPSNVGVYGNDGGLRADVTTLADVFRGAGYKTAWFGKTHWGGNPRFEISPGKDGAERDGDESERSRLPRDARITDTPVGAEMDTSTQQQAIRFLRDYRAKPFFAGVSFVKPHFPFQVQQRYFDLYRDRIDLPRAANHFADLPDVSRQEREKYEFAQLTPEQIRKARAVYFGMVTFMDELIGGILRELDALDLRRNTIILYTADHGEMAGEHGLWYKNSFYQASVGVPMIWSFPSKLRIGRTVGAPVMNMDIFPTLCELCGLRKPDGLEGVTLAGLLSGTDSGAGRIALSENFRGRSASRMLRTEQWKYCYYHDSGEQLFDVRNDPDELRNLALEPAHATVVKQLRERALRDWNYQGFLNRRRGKKK